ncbi:MAG: M23 family metallopeptidase [Candidatus Doudnabacteria bacterium]|nr:M23 family metallopeptidase [Candidatus Doudnabacteria bacterium]
MRVVVCFLLAMLWTVCSEAGQPYGIRLNPNGASVIYPVVDTSEWLMTQPDYGRMHIYPDRYRITHFGDEYFAQDWSRECGRTYGQRLYAGISGKVIFAGSRGPYGQTVVIYDAESRFALKYSHMSEIEVRTGELVLAGISPVGRVGNTGNVTTSGCSQYPGSHLHLALFKNVNDPSARPITTTSSSSGSGPTNFAAYFQFGSSVELVKTASDPAVFAIWDSQAYAVTASGFESHGWNFDKRNSLINPVRMVSAIPYARTVEFWPLRETSLIKSNNIPIVYVFEDGRKLALSSQIFSCRRYRFGEIRTISPGERDSYLPVSDTDAKSCVSQVKQGLIDWAVFASGQGGFGSPDLSSYWVYRDWVFDWGLRGMRFMHSSGQMVELFRTDSLVDPNVRYIGYWVPNSGQWSGWQRVQ